MDPEKQKCNNERDIFNVPGVFNCRFNPVIKRKRKKPTSFVPPPMSLLKASLLTNGNSNKPQLPFWKQPLPPTRVNSSDLEGSVGSRVNIKEKLMEKKQKQFAELKKIEEEIQSGKLKKPKESEFFKSDTFKQPIPHTKKIPWSHPDNSKVLHKSKPKGILRTKKIRSQTPEILLTPHYLENSRVLYEYSDSRNRCRFNDHLQLSEMSESSTSNKSDNQAELQDETDEVKANKKFYKSCRIPSDLDSQISMPRSYTLPREFKYYRKPKLRKSTKLDFFTSTNSSDGKCVSNPFFPSD